MGNGEIPSNNQTLETNKRFIDNNREPLVESDEDILRSKKSSNRIVAFAAIAFTVTVIALLFNYL